MPGPSGAPVSVIITHYNRAELLEQALLSVRNQTVPPAEIIVVDDCSRPDQFEKIQVHSHLATIISTPRNLGLSGARNFGVDAASGEWIVFLDDDDRYLPNRIELQLRFLDQHRKCSAVGAGLIMRRAEGGEEYWGGKTTRVLTLADVLLNTASMAQALMIRRDIYRRLGGFDTRLRYLEDFELGIRLLAAGVEMHFLAEPVFVYHLGGRDQLSARWHKMLLSELRVLCMHREHCRRQFGRFGLARMLSRCLCRYGLKRGRLIGRTVWLAGRLTELVFGKVPAA